MRSVFAISLLLVFSFQVINGNFLDSLHDWYARNFESQIEVRETLPDTGYWNFLPILGLYGRMLHFLVTDSDGFGGEIKKLNRLFKNEYGDEFYARLESRAAESFPAANALFKTTVMLAKIRNVRDKKTQKTLGHAFRILANIADDYDTVQIIVERWNMVRDISDMFKNPKTNSVDSQQYNQLKKLILEHPEIFQKLLSQPDVLNRLSGSILESLRGIDLVKGIESVQEMAVLLKNLYPRNYEHLTEELFQIRDENTNLSFAEGLETISNIMKTEMFQQKLKKLMSTEFLQHIHEISQPKLEQALSPPDPKQALREAVPEKVQQELQKQGVFVSLDKAKSLIQDAINGKLIYTLLQNVEDVEQSGVRLTAASLSERLAKDGIQVSPDKVTNFMQLLQMLPPEMMLSTLQNFGIDAKKEDLQTLAEKSALAAPLEPLAAENVPSSSSKQDD